MNSVLDNSVMYTKGVGEVRARLLEKELGIRTLRDILYHFPFRYVDRTRIYSISEIAESETSYIQIRARIVSKGILGSGGKQRLSLTVTDGTGQATLLWFHGIKWISDRLENGREYIIFGRPSFFHGDMSIIHPEVENVEVALSKKNLSGLQGIYPTTERITASLGTKGLYNIICSAWGVAQASIEDYMPEGLRRKLNLPTLKDALFNIHFPQSSVALQQARYRLKFDELFGIQLNIQLIRRGRLDRNDGFVFRRVGDFFNKFYAQLPFPLTSAQKRVIKEIRKDTVSGIQMNRLLQGDVGSGKTIVALISMILAVDNMYQACIMAPTEILARQHYASFKKMTEGTGLSIAVLTGTTKKKERDEILAHLASGEIHILVGTHALLEDRVVFSNLGFVVIDEQHRFGVEQRARLWTKNSQPPHILVMTATPIPRTLAMTLYGDLDVSIIDELPPGRKPIQTLSFDEGSRLRVIGFMKKQIALGRQIYIVYPLIKESEKMDYMNLEQGFMTIIRDFPGPEYVVTPCHGKMKPANKEESMRQFKDGEADILVATSVIEVGVDVPNASVMIIESAERFGLSQLHQLRGRVGRGAEQSYCILMTGDKLSHDSRERISAMCETNDGFVLAELDMKLRGSGDINGTQQSGEAFTLRIANPGTDGQILELAQRTARDILDVDQELQSREYASLRILKDRYRSQSPVDFSSIS